jgi:hypothetical protein
MCESKLIGPMEANRRCYLQEAGPLELNCPMK